MKDELGSLSETEKNILLCYFITLEDLASQLNTNNSKESSQDTSSSGSSSSSTAGGNDDLEGDECD